MNERDQMLVNVAEKLFGVNSVARLQKLLSAARSKNDVADLIRSAIESKVKAETARLEGIVLVRMEKDGVNAETQAKVKFALGIGSQTESAFNYESIVSQSKTPEQKANGQTKQ